MKLVRAGAIYVAANVASAAVPFLLLPLLTRVLTPAEYGEVVNFFLLVTMSGAVAGLSVQGAVGVAWFNRERDALPGYVGAALVVGIGSTVVTAAVVAGLMSTLSTTFKLALSPAWAAVAAVTAGANVILQCRLVLWQSQKRPMPMAATQIIASLLNVVLSLVAVLGLQLGGLGRNGGAATASCLTAVFAVVALAVSGDVKVQAMRRTDLRAVFHFGALLVPHALGGVLMASTDRLVVATRLGPQELGVYGAAAQLGMVMTVLADAFSKAYNPWLFEKLKSSERRDKLHAVGAMLMVVPFAVVAGAVMSGAMVLLSRVLLGPAYHAASHLLPLFVVGGALTTVYLAISGLYFFYERTARLSSITLPCAIVGAATTVLMASRFGAIGAAAGYALTQGLLAAMVWVVARFTFELPWHQPLTAIRAWFDDVVRGP